MSSSSGTVVQPSAAEAPDFSVDVLRRGGLSEQSRIRLEARRKNGHAVDAAKDGLAYLEIEHDAIAEVMETIVAKATAWCDNQQGSPEEVDTLVSRMVALIAQHASLEERFVYPLFQSHLKGTIEGVSADMIYERNVVDDDMNKRILDLLLAMKLSRDGRLMLVEHMLQEEHWFALLRRQLSADQLQGMADKMRSAASTAPTLPHSLVGPSHGLPSKIAHPVTGVLDRAMDKISGRDTELEKEEMGPHYVAGVQHSTKHV